MFRLINHDVMNLCLLVVVEVDSVVIHIVGVFMMDHCHRGYQRRINGTMCVVVNVERNTQMR